MTDPSDPSPKAAPFRVLCVCLGNICRSPIAEGVFVARAEAAGHRLTVDSAGTSDWHLGDPPDPRAIAAAAARGIDIARQRARQVRPEDFLDFDLILAMDNRNLAKLEGLRPASATARLRLAHPDGIEVPDPYSGGAEGFETVLDMLDAVAESVLAAANDR
ncbi:MAG: low molecular weight protein-tyrosine-phosphatase [Pseudomonadota bacterium]